MLIGMDNQGWMPVHVDSSQLASDNLRLMQSVLSPRCILMGSIKTPEQGRANQGATTMHRRLSGRDQEAGCEAAWEQW